MKTEYETTKEALEKRFEPESKRTLYFVEFQAKGRKKEETWSDFANELRVLADKALPDVEDKAKQLSVFSVSLLTPRLPSRFVRDSLRL